MNWVICQGCGNVFDTEATKTTAHLGCCPKCGLHYQGHYRVVNPILNQSPLAAKPLPERTCKLERHGSLANYPEMVCWSCSECHFGWHHSVNDKQFSYCPNCGAKIVAIDEVTVYAYDGTKVKTDVYALCSTEFDEIVRCKDCIYYAESPDPIDPGWPMYCEFTQQEMLGRNGFCAWGVRREEE